MQKSRIQKCLERLVVLSDSIGNDIKPQFREDKAFIITVKSLNRLIKE